MVLKGQIDSRVLNSHNEPALSALAGPKAIGDAQQELIDQAKKIVASQPFQAQLTYEAADKLKSSPGEFHRFAGTWQGLIKYHGEHGQLTDKQEPYLRKMLEYVDDIGKWNDSLGEPGKKEVSELMGLAVSTCNELIGQAGGFGSNRSSKIFVNAGVLRTKLEPHKDVFEKGEAWFMSRQAYDINNIVILINGIDLPPESPFHERSRQISGKLADLTGNSIAAKDMIFAKYKDI